MGGIAVDCLDDDTILAFVQGTATGANRTRIDAHLDVCDDCRSTVAEAARVLFQGSGGSLTGDKGTAEVSPGDSSAGAEAVLLAAGAKVSRYRIIEIIGVGGAGVVYRAHDPELERAIALKLIRPTKSPSGSRGGAQARLLREARAMAQLSHPNVVAVYDVGTFENQVFVVMELVDGITIGQWLRDGNRSWQEVLEMFLHAAEGLAAAHAAGIVHRDFKPENVLMGADGRVRVTDFGLAHPARVRAVDLIETAADPPPLAPGSGTAGTTRFAGTPAYMAPEQFLGRDTDARTDQFNFCVALYLALYGQHPFGVDTLKSEPLLSLAELVIGGQVRPPPDQTPVPAGVRAVLVRGFSASPDDRFPSLHDLIRDLSRWRRPVMSRARRIARGAAIAAAALVGLTAIGLSSARGRTWLAGLASRCGNGSVEPGEACDDGNASDTDDCLPTCRFAACGDGHLRARVEECDDGNRSDGDGCSARCLSCNAGDAAFTWPETGHCYSRHDAPVTWVEAREVCRRARGDLVTFSDSFETLAVYRQLLAAIPGPHWIGFFDPEASGHFAWVTGDRVDTNFFPWAFEHGDRDAGTCTLQYPGRGTQMSLPMHWAAADCARAAPALCEQPPWLIRARDNHAYLLVSHEVTWHEARAECAERGAHLATMEDADEQTFIVAHAAALLWLGGSDIEKEGTFTWITGEAFSFHGFAPGEPDDPNGISDCIALGLDKGWHDRDCRERRAFVCEIE